MTDTQGSTHTGTALQFDLADAKRQHEWLLERYIVVLDQRNELLEALRGVVRSAGYESGEAEPSLCELNVSISSLDQARTAIEKAAK